MTNTSWKTSLIGIIGAIFVTIKPIITNGTFDIKKDWINLVGAVIIAFAGYFAKDATVTGLPTEKTTTNA